MSKNNLQELTYEERGKLAAQVKTLRTAANLKQSELAEMANISRQALSNIERGSVPQMDNLRRIYEVLGVDITQSNFSAETTQWLDIVGSIMDSMPVERRARAGKAAVDAVTNELVEVSTNVGGDIEDDLEARRQYEMTLAAKKRSSDRGEAHYD